jgi:hypothetical protein
LVVALGLGVLTGASECHGQSKPATVSIAADGEAKVSYDPATKVLTVTPAIAVIVKESDFKWQVGKLPDRHTIEIDFRVHDGRKGPFKRSAEGTTGRYKGGSDSEVKAGAVDYKGRDAWKYDVILRDGAGNDVAAIDPMVIIAQ